VLLGQDGADEAHQGVAAGEDPGDVGPAADLAVEPLLQSPPRCPGRFGRHLRRPGGTAARHARHGPRASR
jgi:hypothetical protein